ncbi:hypothetical protein M885DRAFT_550484 [Pelagophyceae sp. CCMP2097]|nr:hypothetical protein M885DRAFT_550484 [Pelagophyceae sp. CCMP2097]
MELGGGGPSACDLGIARTGYLFTGASKWPRTRRALASPPRKLRFVVLTREALHWFKRPPRSDLFGDERGSLRLADVARARVSRANVRRVDVLAGGRVRRWFEADDAATARTWCASIEAARGLQPPPMSPLDRGFDETDDEESDDGDADDEGAPESGRSSSTAPAKPPPARVVAVTKRRDAAADDVVLRSGRLRDGDSIDVGAVGEETRVTLVCGDGDLLVLDAGALFGTRDGEVICVGGPARACRVRCTRVDAPAREFVAHSATSDGGPGAWLRAAFRVALVALPLVACASLALSDDALGLWCVARGWWLAVAALALLLLDVAAVRSATLAHRWAAALAPASHYVLTLLGGDDEAAGSTAGGGGGAAPRPSTVEVPAFVDVRDVAAVNAVEAATLVDRRFIVACGGDVKAAVRRWRATQAWRADQGVDGLLDKPHPKFDSIKACYPHYWGGAGRAGELLYFENVGRVDVAALERSGVTLADLVSHYVYLHEFQWARLCPQRDGPACRQVVVLDVSGLALRDCGGLRFEYVRQCAALAQQHYPERCGKIIIANAPAWFAVAWRMVRPLVDPATQQKIFVPRTGAETLATLRAVADDDAIPVAYGGTNKAPQESPYERQLRAFVHRHDARSRTEPEPASVDE